MAISTGRYLLAKPNATAKEIEKSIAALNVELDYLQKVMNAGLRARESGNAVIEEIADLIKDLEAKLKCIN
jgi:t-SNARE complex subunit (syntaxin)